ncbi:MAG: CAP domain-containing protein [Pyrinomonadaceae bacterium]
MDRRSFLTRATSFALSLPLSAAAQTLVERGRFDDEQLSLAREQLLKQLNAERARAGLNELKLDDLASRVAQEHARDMAAGGFLNHFGSDGRKPYQRYCLAGGTAAIQENASAAEDIESVAPLRVMNDLRDMHDSMAHEAPPNDGHRKTIFSPFHTHVGFGVALHNHSLRLDELYLARYIELDRFTAEAKAKSTVILSGRLLNPKHFLHGLDLCFEPLPAPREIEWLRANPRPISLPDAYAQLRPRAPDGMTYTDGRRGDYDWDRSGKFRAEIKLTKDEPGIYFVIFWVRRVAADKGFPGAEVCIISRPN